MTKKMTLEDLAAMTSRGFEDVERRLREHVSQEVAASEQRMRDHVSQHVSQEVGKVLVKFADFREENRSEHDQINRKHDATIAVNDQLDRRVSRIEKYVGLPRA